MKYEVLEAGSPAGLAEAVQKRVDEGWRPIGGVSTYTVQQRGPYDTSWQETYFVQAITHTPRELEPI